MNYEGKSEINHGMNWCKHIFRVKETRDKKRFFVEKKNKFDLFQRIKWLQRLFWFLKILSCEKSFDYEKRFILRKNYSTNNYEI